MNPLRSVGGRLSLALVVVVAAALALVDLIVVPSLEHNLIHAKLVQLKDAAPGIAAQYAAATVDPTPTLQAAGESASARVSVFSALDVQTLIPVADSNLSSSRDLSNDPIANQANQLGTAVSGTVQRGENRYAEFARPLSGGGVLLLSASLHDSLANIHLVRRRLLVAGLIALVASLVVGYGAASMFARRLRRLEQAAERIADGDFSEPVSDTGRDEVGELARAFERMRERLAGLERARREFIANASHELRTPLFSLGGHLELLVEEDLDDATRREFLSRMREQVDRLTKLAGELLDLSRLDAGRLRVDRDPVDLAQITELLLEEFDSRAQGTGHELSRDGVDGSATGLGDEQRVLQVGRALVENALRHTPAGTQVVVGTSRNGDRVALTVADDGPGISQTAAVQVFERFYRGDTGGRASGSGLGLAIARELAVAMQGEIELSSEPGRTVFTFWLPAASGTTSPAIE